VKDVDYFSELLSRAHAYKTEREILMRPDGNKLDPLEGAIVRSAARVDKHRVKLVIGGRTFLFRACGSELDVYEEVVVPGRTIVAPGGIRNEEVDVV
jgi:hypothetical protein